MKASDAMACAGGLPAVRGAQHREQQGAVAALASGASAIEPPIAVRVKYTAGAYTTNKISGQRTSSTSSAEHAVLALAHKLLPRAPRVVRRVSHEPGEELWEVRPAYVAGQQRKAPQP